MMAIRRFLIVKIEELVYYLDVEVAVTASR
jgi:hypothetical protein